MIKKQTNSQLTGLQSEFVQQTSYTDNGLVSLDYLPTIRDAATNALVVDGEGVSYGYDHTGAIRTVTNRGVAIRAGSAYTATGQLSSATLRTHTGAQIEVLNGYQAGSNRLLGTTYNTLETQQGAVNTTFANYAYAYDKIGNLTRSAETIGADTQCYRYDAHRRLSDAWTPAGTATNNCAAQEPQNATLGGPAPYRQAWTFNNQGHRATQLTQTPTGTSQETYTYPAPNGANGTPGTNQPNTLKQIDRTTTVTSSANGATPGTTTSTDTFEYDNVGNTTRRAQTGAPEKVPSLPAQNGQGAGVLAPNPQQHQQLAWDAEGNLKGLTIRTTPAPAGTDGVVSRVNYLYGADGTELLRTTKNPTTGKVATTLFLGHTDVTYTDPDGHGTGQPGSTTAERYIDTGAGLTALRDDTTNEFTYLVADAQGSPTMSIGGDRVPTRRYQTPYGGPRTLHTAVNGASANPDTSTAGTETGNLWTSDREFLGANHDNDTGLTSIGARQYDPATGRFISVDPLLDPLDPAQALGYSYSANNPIAYADPNGMMHALDGGGGSGYFTSTPTSTPSNSGIGMGGQRSTPQPQTDPDVQWERAKAEAAMIAFDRELAAAEKAAAEEAAEKAAAEKDKPWYKKAWDGLKKVGKFLADISGVTDLVNSCFTNFDPLGCVVNAAMMLPAGKALKGVKMAAEGLQDARKALKAAEETAAKACSFSGDTPVLTGDGRSVRIDSLVVGDEVLASDPETGEQSSQSVLEVFVHLDQFVELELASGEVLTTTGDHPFWSDSTKQFKQAGSLIPGESVLTAQGETLQVTAVRDSSPRSGELAYNIEVEKIHTYHVGSSEILVHNRCKPGPKPFGVGPHNKKIRQVADSVADGDVIAGGQISREMKEAVIETKGGYKQSRRPDILVRRHDDGSLYGINVGRRSTRTGAPVKREAEALQDLERKLPMHFVAYN